MFVDSSGSGAPCLSHKYPVYSCKERFRQMKADIIPASGAPVRGADLQERLGLALAVGRVGVWEFPLESAPSIQVSTGKRAAVRVANHIFLSKDLQSILGWDENGFDGTFSSLWAKLYRGDQLVVLEAFGKAIRFGTDLELEIRFSQTGNKVGWLLVRGHLYHDEEGRPERLLGTAVDITGYKAGELQATQSRADLERKLAARTQQLRATAEEFDAFCYSVSHDLRAPLRSIRGFNEVLLERYAAKLDPPGQEFLRRACESSHRLDRLIDDLLKLSRVGRAELTRRSVDLSRLASEIAASLQASAPDRQVLFQISPGLRAIGDEPLLRIVLDNLLGNAWKFTSKRVEARVEFGYAAAPVGAFFVRDNGAGFDASYAGRLFGVFQRFHTESEFAGTGVGLAVVKRIIRRHGGEVWAEGAVDGGATFYFSLKNDELL